MSRAGLVCAVALVLSLPAYAKKIRAGYVDIMPAAKAAKYKQLLPRVSDAKLSSILESAETMWYDGESIIPGYQDSMGDPKGFRPNTIQSNLIDLAVPGGWKTLFAKRGRFNFPFGTGGADNSDNLVKINFWSPPRVNGNVLPVAYWKLNFTRWRWIFPVGTVIGEVLLVRMPDGEERIAEIRTRTRELDKWRNEIFRPFPTAQHLADRIREVRPNWYTDPKLYNLVSHLVVDTDTLTPRTLSTQSFPGTFVTETGYVDNLPDFSDVALVKELLTSTTFLSMSGHNWKVENGKTAFAASSSFAGSIVPRNYDGGVLSVDDVSCRRCHSDAGRQIGEFHFNLILYGELWGEDEIFSWHPFDNDMFVQPNGDVKNFNDDNRRVRSDFASAGLVTVYSTSTHTEPYYKILPREWKYNPVR